MSARDFGKLKDGRAVRAHAIGAPDGLQIEILEYGAIVRSIRAPTVSRGLVETTLGYGSLEEYENDKAYMGCVIGRCANRIDGGRFEIDGTEYQVTTNEGANTLHGGDVGFGNRLWTVDAAAEDSLELSYVSPDGEEGFPGTVKTRLAFSLPDARTLALDYEAETDKPTPVNLTHHLYFNLAGDVRATILNHRFWIAGDEVTEVRPDLIPTGRLCGGKGSPFDLSRQPRIGDQISRDDPQIELAKGFDHNWVLLGGDPAVMLRSPESGVALTIATDQPGVQVYSGQGLSAPFVAHGGVALEPQGFPDAVNQPSFPNVVLRPGEVYRRRSIYRFEAGAPG